MQQPNFKKDDVEWVIEQIAKIPDEKVIQTVSEWAEKTRYLPPQVTSLPGFYSYDIAPFLREIADCLSADSHVREIDFMKGAQIGATVGVLENAIGFVIEHLKSSPVLLLTSDSELAKLRVDSYILPMLEYSNLSSLIQSNDETNKRRTGVTKNKIEWKGGGSLNAFGARNADKLRSISVQYLLCDEVDSYPEKVGKDGDPQKLAEARTKAYHQTRKIARISTPLIKNNSRIEQGYAKGDQRKFHVPCKSCGQEQELVFKAGDETHGLIWETNDAGVLKPDTVRYKCKFCGHLHRNSDKTWMLPRGRWVATAESSDPERRSYHISSLYSPVGMFPWEAIVRDWLEAYDVTNKSVKSVGLLQEFYNNVLGLPFEVIGAKVLFSSVSAHRRTCYKAGQVPNKYANEYSGSPVLVVTCQVDVHKSNLAVAVMGWTSNSCCYVIEYLRIPAEKDCSEPADKSWSELANLIEERRYHGDDGRIYAIALTLIDAGYSNDTVVNFIHERYESNVYPILGRDRASRNQAIKEFAPFKTQVGTTGYRILVDHYKDRLASVLRREWSEHDGEQRQYHFNAPIDLPDKSLKELTVESRREKRDTGTGRVSHYWYRPSGTPNELWDLLNYGHAAIDILAYSVCIQHFELETVDFERFWTYINQEQLYFSVNDNEKGISASSH